MSTATVLLLGDDNLGSEVVTLTPADAKKILDCSNTHNRVMRPKAVAEYARDMASGRWAQNGEAIKFDRNGVLLDGQHRLAAIVASGVPVAMLVVTGLAPETQETMDSGRKRSTGDALGLRGEHNATVLASVARRVWMWEHGNHRFSGGTTPTTAECTALLNERPELRRSAEIAVRVHYTFRYLPQSITGAAHHIFSRISQEDAVWFFARLGDGAELPVGHPVLTLRTRIMTDRAAGKHVADGRLMAYLVRTWNAVRDGESLTRLQFGAESAMPMPK